MQVFYGLCLHLPSWTSARNAPHWHLVPGTSGRILSRAGRCQNWSGPRNPSASFAKFLSDSVWGGGGRRGPARWARRWAGQGLSAKNAPARSRERRVPLPGDSWSCFVVFCPSKSPQLEIKSCLWQHSSVLTRQRRHRRSLTPLNAAGEDLEDGID